MLLYCFYYILLKTVPYRSDPFQMDIAYWFRTERFTEPLILNKYLKFSFDSRDEKKEVIFANDITISWVKSMDFVSIRTN